MARLKERDKRPKQRFEPGDIVRPHPKRSDLVTIGDGIVIKINQAPNQPQVAEQQCLVYFSSREVDLWVEMRRWAKRHFCSPETIPEGIWVSNADLIYLDKSHPEWLDPPDEEEILLSRFSDLS